MLRQSFRSTSILLAVALVAFDVAADEFRFSIDRERTIDSTISFVNECKTRKHFDVTKHELGFVSFLDKSTEISTDPGAVESIRVRFDPRELAPGLYDNGYFEINCTDCKLCSQDKREIPVVMRVIEPTSALDPCCDGNPGPDCSEQWWLTVDSFTRSSSKNYYTPMVLPADVADAYVEDVKVATTESEQVVVESSVSITGGSNLKEPLIGTLQSGATFAVKKSFKTARATSLTRSSTYATFEFTVERQFWKEVRQTRWVLEANACCWKDGRVPGGPQLLKWLEDWLYEPSATGRESILVELNALVNRRCFRQRSFSFPPFRERLTIVTAPETMKVYWRKNPALSRQDMLRDLAEARGFLEGTQVYAE